MGRATRYVILRVGLVALLLGAVNVALAQSPPRSPLAPKGPRPTAPVDRSQQPLVAAPVRTTVPEYFVRLPATIRGWTVDGERGLLEWPIYLTSEQARQQVELRIGYISSIHVLPDASRLLVLINGSEVAARAMGATPAERMLKIEVPVGRLNAGFNSIRIVVDQRHRVDCSVAATFELWTSIDPLVTGLVFREPQRINTITDLSTLGPDAGGTLPIRIVSSSKVPVEVVERLIQLTQALSLLSRTHSPVIDFGPAASGQGVNVIVAEKAEFDRLAASLPNPQLIVPGFLLAIADATRRTTLLVESSVETIDSAIEQLNAESVRMPAVPRIRALTDFGNESIGFKTAGAVMESFSGRRLVASLFLRLPDDFFAADYGRVSLKVRGSHATDPDADARMNLSVNGLPAGEQPLTPKSAKSLRYDFDFPTGMLRPGINRFDFSAQIGQRSDGDCLQGVENSGVRFTLSESSSIDIPSIGRLLSSPDLSAMSAGATPYANGKAPRLIVPSPDAPTLAAALTVSAQLAVSAGHLIPFRFSVAKPTDDPQSPTLIVAPAQALDPAVLRIANVNPDSLRQAWERVPPPRTTSPISSTAETAVSRSRTRIGISPACDHGQSVVTPRPELPVRSSARSGVENPAATTSLWQRLWTSTSFLDDGETFSGIALTDQLLVAQGIRRGHAPFTIVTAPTAELLQQSVACLVDPQVWNGLNGQIALMRNSALYTVAAQRDQLVLQVTQPYSFSNSRLVLAGWLSLNPFYFTATGLGLACLLAISTWWLVRNVGRRQP
jgi:hypothetical protein